MSTCLDDINATLESIDANIALLAPTPPFTWGAIASLQVLQPGVISMTQQTQIGFSVDEQTILLNAVLTITGAGTAGNELRIGGLVDAFIDGGLIGHALLNDGGAYTAWSVWWFSDGYARLIGNGESNNWGLAPSLAIASGDVIRLNLSYRGA